MARHINTRLRFEILRRDGFRCVYCGSSPGKEQLKIDHKIPYAKGGTDDPKNLVTSCQECNWGKTDRQLDRPRRRPGDEHRPPQTLQEVQEELELVRTQLRKRSLKRFVLDAYPLLQTGTELVWGWYLDAICEHLQALIEPNSSLKRLVINIKNRSFKSSIASICLNPWAWLTQPHLRFLTGGHDQGLALEHCWSSRLLIRSEWYRRMLDPKERWILDEAATPDPAWELAADQDQKSFYANTQGGRRIAVQVGAGTGKGAKVFVIDDPLGIDQSYSDLSNETANRWFLQTIMSRLDDPADARIAVIQHRLRPDDTSGEILRNDLGFEVVTLPLEFDPKRIMPATSIGWVDPRTDEGESLCPQRWGDEQIEQDKLTFGDLYEAVCNQNPQKRGASLIRREWFKTYTDLPERHRVVQSWDLSTKGLDPTVAQKGGKKRSKVGALVAAMTDSECYLMDCYHQHADYIEQKKVVLAMHGLWERTERTYVEDESNGSALILELTRGNQDEPGVAGIVGVNPSKKGSKYQRLAAVAHYVRAGNVYVPDPASNPWVVSLLDQLCGFPNTPYDELPDVFSQLLSEEWLPEGLNKRGEQTPEERAAALRTIYGEGRPRQQMNGGVVVQRVQRGR